ncbi:MAG: serine racemase VanT catalytic subunit [Clostridia bacterium]|nr:serine racemase VanT catalytic subunit [Clostridia bacterium]
MKEKESILQDRAFIELNFSNLAHNIEEIKKVIDKDCKIMAVVKANAYGHGIVQIAKMLNRIGVKDFAVATLSEGILLRKHHIDGNILILGYTDVSNIEYVIEYDLMQTIIDYEYAKKIETIELKSKLKVHVKINTGMNRIGENYENMEKLQEIYQMKNIEILGTYTHLCVADSFEEEDGVFTKIQIDRFNQCIEQLKRQKCDVGKVHVQSSYGVLNYPYLKYDFVRVGIVMYGVYSNYHENTVVKLNLRPVLSLKARITSVKEIKKGEAVSYGRTFVADESKKIATVSIGYADGYPRNLSGQNVEVLVNGKYAKIIGRICMDQLIIDVSNVSGIKQGDLVTFIGDKDEISAEKIASASNTITNELLSRLGNRIERISKE